MPIVRSMITLLFLNSILFASDPQAILSFRAPEEIGEQATVVEGQHRGETAIQVTGSPTLTKTTIVDSVNPPTPSNRYIVRGYVKYRDVQGDGYLELLNHFGDKGTFFTRANSSSGPLQKLHGTSDWRLFELPFYAEPGMTPEKLTLNVVLPGPGEVILSQPLVLTSSGSPADWWTNQQSGMLGAILGTTAGLLGALVGIAAWTGQRNAMLGLCIVGMAGGGISLIAGLIAFGTGQPYHVYYPLLLMGVIGLFVILMNLYSIRHQIQADELRRMQATDAVTIN